MKIPSILLSALTLAASLQAAPVKFPVSFPGTWQTTGRVTVSAAPNAVTVSGGYVVTKEQFTDCEFSFQAKALTVSGTDVPVQIWGGVRVKDLENRYVVGVRGGAEPELSFARYAADGKSKFLGWVKLDPAPKIGEVFTVRVAASGNRFHVYLNDEKLPRINIEDKDALWTEGGVALGGGWLPVEFSQPTVSALNGAKLSAFNAVGEQTLPGAVFDRAERRKEQRAAYQPVKITALPAGRAVFSLDGNWLFMPDPENKNLAKSGGAELADDDWHVMPVPAFWKPVLGWLHGEGGLPGLKDAQASRGPSDMVVGEEYARLDALTFDWRKMRSGWYRHYVDLPADIQGREVELVFDAIAKISEVWVNGARAGSNIGMYRQSRYNVTKLLKPGKNLIAVYNIGSPDSKIKDAGAVADIAVTVEITNEMLRSFPNGMTPGDSGGIWQPVRLEMSSSLRVSDVFIQPALDGMAADVELTNSGDKERAVTVSYTIKDAADQSVFDKSAAPLTVKVPANGTASVKLSSSKNLKPKLWTPAAPNLYVLSLSVSDGRAVTDQLDTRFGFRTFTVSDGKLMLNSKPYRLRGGNHFPSTLRPNDKALAEKFIKLAREGNVMVTRSHGMPFTTPWFEAADEFGMGVSYEGTWPWLLMTGPPPAPEVLKVWKNEFVALIKQHRNHPSLLFWTVNNEMFFASRTPDPEMLKDKWVVLDDIIREIRKLDPTRPIVPYSGYTRHETEKQSGALRAAEKYDDGDIDDAHAYYGWYNETPFNLFDGRYGKRSHTAGRPLISQEMSTGYPRNDDWPSRSYQFARYVPQALVGNYAFEQNDPLIFMTRQAFMTKEVSEVLRRSNREEDQGILHFAYLTWFTDVWKADTIRPKLTYFDLKYSLQPVLVSAELYGRHLYAGETQKRRVAIINDAEDGNDLASGTLAWEIKAGDKVLSQGKVNTDAVPYYTNQWLDVEFASPSALPAPRVNAKLWLTLTVGGKVVSQNYYDIVVATREWAAAPNDGGQLFDPSGKAKEITAKLGLSAVTPSQLNSDKLLVVGDVAALSTGDNAAKFKKYVEDGGRALLLNAGKDALTLFPAQLKSYRKTKGEIVTMLAPESPLFDGIEPLDTAWFEMGEKNLPLACNGTYETDRETATPLALECRIHPDLKKIKDENGKETGQVEYFADAGAPIVEIKLGKGKVIISEMTLEAADRDPIAGRLLANMLKYLK